MISVFSSGADLREGLRGNRSIRPGLHIVCLRLCFGTSVKARSCERQPLTPIADMLCTADGVVSGGVAWPIGMKSL
jgi:hypothetical protein